MQRIFGLIKDKAEKLLAGGTVNRIIGWTGGEFFYDPTPAVFKSKEELEGLVYNSFCASNLSKYLINESKKDGKILALLKPCDTYGFNQLVKEHRINKDNVYVLGIECSGMIDINKIRDLGIKGITGISEEDDSLVIQTIYGEKSCRRSDVLLEKCLCCKGKQHMAYDELVCSDKPTDGSCQDTLEASAKPSESTTDRFEMVKKVEAMSPEERYSFWRDELSKCIRCNACRNICPSCSCVKCVFDNDASGIASKANTDAFEENLFHIIRAFHVAGRCTDCGECSRVCPQHIPLHLLNRKIIKDINELYGEYQAGKDAEYRGPLTDFAMDDPEPGIVAERGGDH